jgi:hypothetical protein
VKQSADRTASQAAVKAFVLAAFAQLEARIQELEEKVQKLTPQNSSLPPSTQHPHAKPKRPKRDGIRHGPEVVISASIRVIRGLLFSA